MNRITSDGVYRHARDDEGAGYVRGLRVYAKIKIKKYHTTKMGKVPSMLYYQSELLEGDIAKTTQWSAFSSALQYSALHRTTNHTNRLDFNMTTADLAPFEFVVIQDGTRHQGCDESSGWTWYAAQVLERVLTESNNCKGKRILELGAGTGWMSLRMAQHGAIVTATDRPGACSLLTRNIFRNQERWAEQSPHALERNLDIEVHPLQWDDLNQRIPGQWDLIVASDVVYLKEYYEALLDTCVRHGTPGQHVLITWEERKAREEAEFLVLAAAYGYQFSSPTVVATNPATGGPVWLLQMVHVGN